jgi:hypothetical protein
MTIRAAYCCGGRGHRHHPVPGMCRLVRTVTVRRGLRVPMQDIRWLHRCVSGAAGGGRRVLTTG